MDRGVQTESVTIHGDVRGSEDEDSVSLRSSCTLGRSQVDVSELYGSLSEEYQEDRQPNWDEVGEEVILKHWDVHFGGAVFTSKSMV